MTEVDVEGAIAPRKTQRIRVTADAVEFLGARGIVGMRARSSTALEIALANPSSENDGLQEAVDRSQKKLIANISKALESTMNRVGSSFSWHLYMNVAVFSVGLGSFALAAFKGLADPDRTDAIVAAAFGGLSAVTFLAYFISRPIAAVASAGPEAAWLLGTVNTYWTKLIYLNNPSTFVREIETAQKDFEDSMVLFLKTVKYVKRADPADVTQAEDSEAAKKAAAKKAAAKKTAAKKTAAKKTAAKKTAAKKTAAKKTAAKKTAAKKAAAKKTAAKKAAAKKTAASASTSAPTAEPRVAPAAVDRGAA